VISVDDSCCSVVGHLQDNGKTVQSPDEWQLYVSFSELMG
jgi:hypothetical protein